MLSTAALPEHGDTIQKNLDCGVESRKISNQKKNRKNDRFRKSVIELQLAEIDALTQHNSQSFRSGSFKLVRDETNDIPNQRLTQDDIAIKLNSLWNSGSDNMSDVTAQAKLRRAATTTASVRSRRLTPDRSGGRSHSKTRRSPVRRSKSRTRATSGSSASPRRDNSPKSRREALDSRQNHSTEEEKGQNEKEKERLGKDSKKPQEDDCLLPAEISKVDRDNKKTQYNRMILSSSSEHGTKSTSSGQQSSGTTCYSGTGQFPQNSSFDNTAANGKISGTPIMRGRKPQKMTEKSSRSNKNGTSNNSPPPLRHSPGRRTATRSPQVTRKKFDSLSKSEHGTNSTTGKATYCRPKTAKQQHQSSGVALSKSKQTTKKRSDENYFGVEDFSSYKDFSWDEGHSYSSECLEFNELRGKHGLALLRQCPLLDALALEYAKKMAKSEGTYKLRTHNHPGYVLRGEKNSAIMSALMYDDGHLVERQNILNESFREFGVGSYRSQRGVLYICHLFSGPFVLECRDV